MAMGVSCNQPLRRQNHWRKAPAPSSRIRITESSERSRPEGRGYSNLQARIRFVTLLRRICLKTATIFEPSRSCLGTEM